MSRLLQCAALALVAGCTEILNTNPYHPEYPLTITIHGKDTLWSVRDTLVLSAETDPVWPDAPLQFLWLRNGIEADAPEGLLPLPTGLRYLYASVPPGGALTVTAIVRAGPHTARKDIVLTQRVRQIRPYATCANAICAAFVEDGTGWVHGTMFDSLGTALSAALPMPSDMSSSVVSRAPGIATITGVRQVDNRVVVDFTPVSRGFTWFSFTKYANDSLRVYVDYRPETVRMTCPTTLKVQESVQVSGFAVGATGLDLLVQPEVRYVPIDHQGHASVTPQGMLSGVTPGVERIGGIEMLTMRQGHCDVTIEP